MMNTRRFYLTAAFTVLLSYSALAVGDDADALDYVDEATGVIYQYWKGDAFAQVKRGTGGTAGSPGVSGHLRILDHFTVDDEEYQVADLGMYCFSGCSDLESVVVPGSVKHIGYGAFKSCASLKSVVLEEGVETCENDSFSYCDSLQSIHFPATFRPWEGWPFQDCPLLSDIVVADGNPELDCRDGCNAVIQTATNTLLLGGCGTVIPESVEHIGRDAFQRRQLKEIKLPPGLKSIGRSAFSQCLEISKVVLPAAMQSIGRNAFFNCIRLKEVTTLAQDPYDITDAFYDFYGNGWISGCTLYVPAGCKEKYGSVSPWNKFDKIEELSADYIYGYYPRKVVAEEGTGTWCQWCPQGIVTSRLMLQNHPDDFIQIAVHGDDEMESPTYGNLKFDFFPSFRLNRNGCIHSEYFGALYADYGTIEAEFQRERQRGAVAAVSIETQWADALHRSLTITARTRFAYDMDDDFRLSFALTENQVGPYVQQNGFSGGYLDMGGFESEPETISMLHDHVARYISSLEGTEGTLPESPRQGETYTCQRTLPMPDNVQNDENIEIVALLFKHYGTHIIIENADRLKAVDILAYDPAGIEEVSNGLKPRKGTFTLHGRRLSEQSLPHGVFIVDGKKVLK